MRVRRLLIAFFIAVPAVLQSQAPSIVAGPDGAARITIGGKQIRVAKERRQTGIREPQVAPDGTAGWLVEYQVEGVESAVAATLTLWRGGRTIRRFPTQQSFWSWSFYAEGKQVAFHTGPLHGEPKSHCELHDVASGRLIAQWDGDLGSPGNRPAWTSGLSH